MLRNLFVFVYVWQVSSYRSHRTKPYLAISFLTDKKLSVKFERSAWVQRDVKCAMEDEKLLLVSLNVSEYHNCISTCRKRWVIRRSRGPHTHQPWSSIWWRLINAQCVTDSKSECIVGHKEWRLNAKTVSSNLCKYESLFKALVSPLIKTTECSICLKAWSVFSP